MLHLKKKAAARVCRDTARDLQSTQQVPTGSCQCSSLLIRFAAASREQACRRATKRRRSTSRSLRCLRAPRVSAVTPRTPAYLRCFLVADTRSDNPGYHHFPRNTCFLSSGRVFGWAGYGVRGVLMSARGLGLEAWVDIVCVRNHRIGVKSQFPGILAPKY